MRVVFSPNGTHPFDMGDFRVLATSRRTRVRLRVAVLLKSPHLKRLRSARPLARPRVLATLEGSLRKLRFLRRISGQINAAVGIIDIVRLAVSSLFTRLGISCRLLPRRSSPNPRRLASSLALGPLDADLRRHPRHARGSARSPRTVAPRNTTLIHRSSPSSLTYAA